MEGRRKSIQIEIFQLQSQCQVVCTWKSKQRNTLNSWLINHKNVKKEWQQSSILIDHQFHSSSQRCLLKKTANSLRPMKTMKSFSTLITKWSPCWTFLYRKRLNKQEWLSLKKRNKKSWKFKLKNTKRSEMLNWLRHNVLKQLNSEENKSLIEERYSKKREKKKKELLIRNTFQESLPKSISLASKKTLFRLYKIKDFLQNLLNILLMKMFSLGCLKRWWTSW